YRNAFVCKKCHVQRNVLRHDVHGQAAVDQAASGYGFTVTQQEGGPALSASGHDALPDAKLTGLAVGGHEQDPITAGLDVYIVGGAVRDALLGLPAGDRDWVV